MKKTNVNLIFSPKRSNENSGSLIVGMLIIILFLFTIVSSLIVLGNSNLTRSRGRVLLLEAQYAAESGADAAIAIINSGNTAYSGSAGEVQVLSNTLYKATFSTTVVTGSSDKERIITSTGRLYAPKNAATASYSRKIEAIAQRSGNSITVSMLSRNILATGSSVKDLQAKDVLVNGFIDLTKNVNNLIAENITVGDKDTGASNCSIESNGSLTKPSSFSTPGQTKTNITTAYNNCLTPPGNTSNANFNVAVNQTNISKVASTYIPWSQYMDNTYLNASSCNDWTTGSSPRSIPSTGNTKKTHFPDSSSNVSNSCGSSGDLSLGSSQYNIKDHVHIRANLCTATACDPIFYNPDSGAAGIKFIFVEGTVNFNSVTTASGSGPIVLVVYGADPASKASVCPYGGAFFLDNGQTNAPALYVLATNGLCLSKSKFAAIPALGGISGKNLYIDTNSGSPFDLHFDVNFPVSSVPSDLSWRAIRYRRI